MKQIKDTIKELRIKLGLSQGQLAERAGLSVAYISKLEDGQYSSLRVETCKALSVGFGMNLREFLEEVGIISNNLKKPSFAMVGTALRTSGYTQNEVDKVMEYAKFLKSNRTNQ